MLNPYLPAAWRVLHRIGLVVAMTATLTAVWSGGVSAAAGADSVAALAVSPAAAPPGETATVKLGNREVVEFRGRFLGYSPAERAAAAKERLSDVVREHSRRDTRVVVRVEQSDLAWLFYVDERWVFGVTAADVDALARETLPDLVERTRRNLEAAVSASLEQRSVSGVVRGTLLALLATLIYGLLLRGLARLVGWAGRRLGEVVEARTGQLNLPPTALINQLDNLVRGITRVVGVVVGLGLTNVWLTFVFKQFPYTYPWGDQIDDYLISVGATVGAAVLHAVPNILILFVIWLITRFVIKWVRLFFEAVRGGRIEPPGVDAETALPAQRLVTLFIWLLAVAIAFPFIPGSSSNAFKGLSVLFGLMLSLGSSNVVSQAASGYMLMFAKVLRVGDYVRVGEYEGFVMSLGLLSTKIRTPRDEEINVPNSLIVGSTMKNYSRLNKENGVPITTSVTIGYGTPWRQVHAMLLEAAAGTPGLRRNPEPRVVQSALTDFYVEYALVARLEVPEGRMLVLSALHANVQDIFNEYGVQIMSPHYEGDPEGKVWVPKEKWYEAPATTEARPRSSQDGREHA